MTAFKSLLLVITLFFVLQIVKAQTDTKTYDFKNFDKIQIQNINGEVEIELGKSFQVIVSGKDHVQEQVQISKAGDTLLVKWSSQFDNDWKSRKVAKVNIVMPAISKLFNYSNADVNIKNVAGRYFGIENKGNGDVSVSGAVVDHIEITNDGNGNIATKNSFSKKVDIAKSGNGDVSINTDKAFSVEMAGNGDIVNYGKGKAIIKKQSGTGKVVYRN